MFVASGEWQRISTINFGSLRQHSVHCIQKVQNPQKYKNENKCFHKQSTMVSHDASNLRHPRKIDDLAYICYFSFSKGCMMNEIFQMYSWIIMSF